MRYRPRRYRKRRRSRLRDIHLSQLNAGLFVLLLGIAVAVTCITVLSARLSPLVTVVAVDEVNNEIHQIVNHAVDSVIREQALSYGDIVSLERGEQGIVTSASSNMAAINSLRTELTARILEKIDGIDLRELDIPLGNLTGVDLLSGRGPALRVEALWIGTIRTELENEFSSAGINQTLHRLMLQVAIPATILLPTGQTETTVTTQVCIAENIIIGSVPGTYIQVEP